MKYIITCISHGRPECVAEMSKKMGTQEITFFVKDQKDVTDYSKAGATNVHASGSLMESRNAALEYAFKRGNVCVQLSDDLVKVKTNDLTGTRLNQQEVSGLFAINTVIEEFMDSGSHFGGFPPTDNPFFATKALEKDKFIVGDFILVKPTHLRFDAGLRLKEDYDFTLQNLQEYGEVARFGSFLMSFKHYSNKGGAVSYRTAQLEQETIKYLIHKWPDCIKINSKRENEILLDNKSVEILERNKTQISLF